MTDHNSPHQSDHERLDVYQLELAFVSWVTSLLIEIRDNAKGFHPEVCQHPENRPRPSFSRSSSNEPEIEDGTEEQGGIQ